MSEKLVKVIQAIIDKELLQIQISFVAKIVTFDKSKMTAEISPLLKTTAYNGSANVDTPMQNIKDVRVEIIPGIRQKPYVAGDLVKVECSTSQIEGAIENGLPVNILGHKFSISFVTIRGRFNPKKTTPLSHWSNDGLILGDDPNFYINFKSDQIYHKGKTVLADNLEVKGNSRSFVTHAELNTALQTFITALNLHTHAVTTAPGTTAPPTTPSSLDISLAKTDNIKTGAG